MKNKLTSFWDGWLTQITTRLIEARRTEDIAEYNLMVDWLIEGRADIVTALKIYYNQMSDLWRSSDVGVAYEVWIETWEDFSPEYISETYGSREEMDLDRIVANLPRHI